MAIALSAEKRVGRLMEDLARGLAFCGGVLLMAVALTTVASIIGRALLPFGLGPVRGDFELVETGCAIAVFFFLPWCQLRRGHVTVDVVADSMTPRLKAILGLLGDVAISLVAALILWRLYLGFGEKFPYGSDGLRATLGMRYKPFFPETTYELQLPIWIPYGFAVLGAALFLVVSLYSVWRALNWVLDGVEMSA